jgi:putative phage-type endonuclease
MNALAHGESFGLSREDLALRRHTLGASEIAAVLDLNPWMSMHDVWTAKVLGTEKERTEAMDLGNELEAAILGVYCRRYGREVRRGRYTVGAEPWMSCTPDAHVVGGGLVEAKLAGLRTLWMYGTPDTDEQESDAAPVHYVAQALWQMEITGEPFVHVATLMGTEFRRYTIRPNPGVQRAMVERGRQFWHDYVLTKREPPADHSDGAREMLKRLYPRSSAERVAATPELENVARELLAARRTHAAAERAKKAAENRMKQLLKDASGAFGEGWTVRYATTKANTRPFVFEHEREDDDAAA